MRSVNVDAPSQGLQERTSAWKKTSSVTRLTGCEMYTTYHEVENTVESCKADSPLLYDVTRILGMSGQAISGAAAIGSHQNGNWVR